MVNVRHIACCKLYLHLPFERSMKEYGIICKHVFTTSVRIVFAQFKMNSQLTHRPRHNPRKNEA